MNLFFGIILIGFILAPFPYAMANEHPEAEKKPKVIFKKQEKISFEGLKLRGELKKPDLTYIYKRKGVRDEKIVNIPEDFNSEILEGLGHF